jgi:hypothetical protein
VTDHPLHEGDIGRGVRWNAMIAVGELRRRQRARRARSGARGHGADTQQGGHHADTVAKAWERHSGSSWRW